MHDSQDSAVTRDADLLADALPPVRSRRRVDPASSVADVDTERKLARAARSAQRLAQLSEAQRVGETLDLFAEDAERANQQALNTDIRQGTFEGFELPDVFLAAVQQRGVSPGANTPDAAATPAAQTRTAPPVQTSFHDVLAQDEASSNADEAPATARTTTENAPRASVTQASNLVASDRLSVTPPNSPNPSRDEALPELDCARVRAFADTIDALHAVIVEQRVSTAAHARRMKTMLTVIVCAMLVTVTTGIAQTTILLRMRYDGTLQGDRMEQLMLNQQATLATLFDTDSANVPMLAAPDASPVQPVSTAHASASAKAHDREAHRHSGGTGR